MTGIITTASVNSFKQQLFQGAHCFQATQVQTGNTITGNTLILGLTSTANLVVGMKATSTNVAANAYIGCIVNTTAVRLCDVSVGTGQESITFSGDIFKLALIKFNPTGTYDRNITTYNQVSANTDEVVGANYTAGGFTLTNLNPSLPDSNTAIATFSANPTWTSATIDAAGCIIYNSSSTRLSSGNNMAVSCHDFGGEQKVTVGTITVNLPTANGSAAILRIG